MPQDPSEKMFSIIYHEHYIHTKGTTTQFRKIIKRVLSYILGVEPFK